MQQAVTLASWIREEAALWGRAGVARLLPICFLVLMFVFGHSRITSSLPSLPSVVCLCITHLPLNEIRA
jgi:hypothetical protein